MSTVTHLPESFPVSRRITLAGSGMRTLCGSKIRTHTENAEKARLTCTSCQDRVRLLRTEFQELFRMTEAGRLLRRSVLQRMIDACNDALQEGRGEFLVYGRFVYLNTPFFTWRSKSGWPCTWQWGLDALIDPGGDEYQTQEDAVQAAHTYIDQQHLDEQEHQDV